MASAISGFINQIITAVYGEQVRGAIVSALEACYSDVNNPSLQTEAFETALNEAYAGGILDIQTVTSFNDMTNQNIIYRYNGTAAGKQKGLYYYSALSNSWVLIGSEIQKVSLANQMTDVNDIYRYIGTETGMKQNSLYCHNGTAWVPIGNDIETDTTLSQAGKPADAKATGDAIAAINAGLTQEEKQTIYDLFKSAAYTSADAAANVTKLRLLWNIEDDVDPGDILDGVTFVSGKTINQTDGSIVSGNASTYVTSEITVLSLVKSCIKVIFGAASNEHRIAFYDSNHNTILVLRINIASNESLLAVVPQNAAYMRFAGVLSDNTINVKYFPARTNLVTAENMLPDGQYINQSNGAIAYGGGNVAAKVDVDPSTSYTLANIASGAIYSGDTFSASIAYQAQHNEREITTGAGQTKLGVNKVSTELLPMGVFKTSELATIGTLTVEV